jgi:hypothetical protein
VKGELKGFAGCGDFEFGFVPQLRRRAAGALFLQVARMLSLLHGPADGRGRGVAGRPRAPAVGYRQWVLAFPDPMAVRLGHDAPLLAAIAGRLARAVMQDMRNRVKQQHGRRKILRKDPRL